jgi:ATP-dependent RNA helicase DDX1
MTKRARNAPLAIIIEPSKELAEQTYKQVQMFKKYLENPTIRELLVVGGLAIRDQIASLQDGVDVVVATPGRLVGDFFFSIDLKQIRLNVGFIGRTDKYK